jgi:hypothetical protein
LVQPGVVVSLQEVSLRALRPPQIERHRQAAR